MANRENRRNRCTMERKRSNTNSQWKLEKGYRRMVAAEVLGTGILLFIGCMGCINKKGQPALSAMHMSMGFGLTVNLIIMMLGHISGAHLNPAVTVGAILIGEKNMATGLAYIAAQTVGAFIGYAALVSLTPADFASSEPFCLTVVHPTLSVCQAVSIEIICTSFILLGACATWDPRCDKMKDSTPLRFGFSVTAISYAAGPYTGCSMNPARSFGPSLYHGMWDNHWIYWFGPISGALIGTLIYKFTFLELKKDKKVQKCFMGNINLNEECLGDSKISKDIMNVNEYENATNVSNNSYETNVYS